MREYNPHIMDSLIPYEVPVSQESEARSLSGSTLGFPRGDCGANFKKLSSQAGITREGEIV